MESMDCKQDLCTGSYIAPMDPAMEEVFQGDHLASGNKEFNLDELLEFLKSPTRREKSTFAVIESNKDRGKPYFVERDPNMITSKPETQIPVELMGGQAGDRIRISLIYDCEDSQEESLRCAKHPFMFIIKAARNMKILPSPSYQSGPYYQDLEIVSVANETVKFSFSMQCLNSCTQVCSDRIIQFKHLDNTWNALETSDWKIRVCRIPKRDHELWFKSLDRETGKKSRPLYGGMAAAKRVKLEDGNPSGTWEAPAVIQMSPQKIKREIIASSPMKAMRLSCFDDPVIFTISDLQQNPLLPEKQEMVAEEPPLASLVAPPVRQYEVSLPAKFDAVQQFEGPLVAPEVQPYRFLGEMNNEQDFVLIKQIIARMKGRVLEFKPSN